MALCHFWHKTKGGCHSWHTILCHLWHFSSYTDTIIVWDATRDEVLEWFADLAANRARQETMRILDHVESGEPEKAYHQFAMTWDEALEEDREHDGEVWRRTEPAEDAT